MSDDYLMHYGRKGMKWYQNIFTDDNIKTGKKITKETSNIVNTLKKTNNSGIEQKTKKRKAKALTNTRQNVSEMSDAQMRSKINRELLERQYAELFNSPSVPRGREYVKRVLDAVGTVLGVSTSVFVLAEEIKKVMG